MIALEWALSVPRDEGTSIVGVLGPLAFFGAFPVAVAVALTVGTNPRTGAPARP